jgi:hypothetical protein
MLTGNSMRPNPVMKISGTVETDGSNSHMCAEIGDDLCICRLPVYMCTYGLPRVGLQRRPC